RAWGEGEGEEPWWSLQRRGSMSVGKYCSPPAPSGVPAMHLRATYWLESTDRDRAGPLRRVRNTYHIEPERQRAGRFDAEEQPMRFPPGHEPPEHPVRYVAVSPEVPVAGG